MTPVACGLEGAVIVTWAGAVSSNKAIYTAVQSRTVEQEQYRKIHSEFRNVTDGPTDMARCRVACPRLKTNTPNE